jgi:hypothetical protein
MLQKSQAPGKWGSASRKALPRNGKKAPPAVLGGASQVSAISFVRN